MANSVLEKASSKSAAASAHKAGAEIVVPRIHPKSGEAPANGRRRYSIALSQKSATAFDWRKETTDADTDSEVIRNALRLHYALLTRFRNGEQFYVTKNGEGTMTRLDLFHIE